MPSPLRILLIEDSPADARLLMELLRRPVSTAFALRHEERLDTGLAALQRESFDAVLLDLGLPDSSGLDTLTRVVEAVPELPVVVSTGRVEEEIAIAALRLGAQEYVLKDSWNPETLVRILRYAVERKQAERKLHDSQERLRRNREQYRQLFDHHPVPMWVYDSRTFSFLAVNDAAIEHYGWSRDEFLALTVPDLLVPEERAALVEALTAAHHDQEVRDVGSGGVWTHLTKDGSRIEVEGASSGIRFEGRDARLVMAIDVTEKRLLDARLIETQKMEAIALLAGGVAHDFNNLLTLIEGHGELLQSLVEPSSPASFSCDQIRQAARGAANLTRQLLTFSRNQVVNPQVLDLSDEVRRIADLLTPLLGEAIELVLSLPADAGRILADRGQLEQVLLNLAINARDAMPKGGRLALETSRVEVDADLARHHPGLVLGHYVRLCVSDTGHGIDPETLSHVFEPFFTTKPVGKGTGLGLSTAHGIVRQSGGQIVVYSEVGQGTTFQIFLPRIAAPAQPTSANGLDLPPGGTETVLVVEDVEPLRRLVAAILRSAGYQVLEATDPAHAVEIARTDPRPIHCLLTDVVMPRQSGPELAAEIRRERGDLRTLFLSGYTPEALLPHGDIDVQKHFLQKPFNRATLLRKLRDVLDDPAEAPR